MKDVMESRCQCSLFFCEKERYCIKFEDFCRLTIQTQGVGTLRFAYAYRNTDVRLCVVGSIALYLFFRFQINGEPWPDFSPSFKWHDIKLLRPGRGSSTEMLSYPAQLKAIKEVFERFDIDINCYTHAGRKAAVEIGATGIARGPARQFAGVKSRDAGHYYLKRGQLEPPESLQKTIFP